MTPKWKYIPYPVKTVKDLMWAQDRYINLSALGSDCNSPVMNLGMITGLFDMNDYVGGR
jgi:hypothetical protein